MRKQDWTPDIIIALVVIVLGFAMRFCGINGEIWAMVLLAGGWVFGKQYEVVKERKREKNGN